MPKTKEPVGYFTDPLTFFDESYARKISKEYWSQDYQLVPTSGKQPLNKGRVELRPRLELNDYDTKAVIDWLEISFRTEDVHQAGNMAIFLIKELKKMGSASKVFVSGLDRKYRYQGDHFLVRIQNPQPEELKPFLEAVSNKYQPIFVNEPPILISGMEVSVDFYPALDKDADQENFEVTRWKMTEVLCNHLYVPRVLNKQYLDRPRFYNKASDASRGVTTHLLTPKAKSPDALKSRARKASVPIALLRGLDPTRHNKPPIDATFYVGKKNSPVFIKIMDKVTDGRNPNKNTFVDLEKEKRRSRIEVTFWRPDMNMTGAINQIGLDVPTDLFTFKFVDLRKRIFDFYYPTIEAIPKSEVEISNEIKIFKDSGSYGLEEYQRAENYLQWKEYEKKIITETPKRLRDKGHRLSYTELNAKVERALNRLSKSWNLGEDR